MHLSVTHCVSLVLVIRETDLAKDGKRHESLNYNEKYDRPYLYMQNKDSNYLKPTKM